MSATVVLAPPAAKPRREEEPLYEVVRGIRVELPEMGAEAAVSATELSARMRIHATDRALGCVVCEAMFVIDPLVETKRRPDVAFVSAERWPLDRPPPTGEWEVVPDLVVEVVSPHDALYAVREKVDEYFAAGVREVWVIVPPWREATIYTLDRNPRALNADDMLETPLLPGFQLPLAKLFPWRK